MKNLKNRAHRALRWSEKYTKTDMIYLARGGFWSTFGQISASIIALGLAVIMARYVSKDAYGSYKYILATISIIATLSMSGLSTAVFQSVAQGYRSAVSEGLRENLRWSLLVFLGAFLGGGYYLMHGNTTLGIGILIGGCITPFLTGFNLYSSMFAGEKDFRAVAWYGDFVTNIIPAVSIALVAYFAPQPLFLLLAYFLANATAAGYAYWRAIRKYPDIEKKHDPGMLSYSKHLSAMNILGGIAGNIDQVLLFHFVGPVQLAIYNFATAIPNQVKGPMKMLDVMMQAQFVKRIDIDIAKSMRNKMLWLFIGTLTFVTTYILSAPFIFKILFPTYIVATPYSQVYVISLFTLITYPISSLFTAKKYIKAQYINTIINNVIQIVVMIAGIIGWGLWGLIVARIFSRLFASLMIFGLYMINRQ